MSFEKEENKKGSGNMVNERERETEREKKWGRGGGRN
jgi:hypothetical protein